MNRIIDITSEQSKGKNLASHLELYRYLTLYTLIILYVIFGQFHSILSAYIFIFALPTRKLSPAYYIRLLITLY